MMRTVYRNGRIYAGDGKFVKTFAVEDGKFCFAGEELPVQPEDRVVDLAGKFVCPGFNDSHMHLLNFGQSLNNARLDRHTGSLEDMLGCLRKFLETRIGSGWLMGRGWNQDYFSDVHRMPNRYDLDRVSTQVPICAVRACGHALCVNSKALEILGITADTPQIDGGEIVMENGEPNGLLLDSAMDLVYDALAAPDLQAVRNMLRSACKELNRVGITSCQSDDYCVFAELPWQTVNQALRELEEAGELTVRVYEQSNFTNLQDLTEFVEAGNVTGTGSDLFKIGPLKMLGDGALGPRTAFLTVPYADAPDTKGLAVFSQETLDEMIGYANRHGMQVAVHAIGDACTDRVLSAIEKALADCPRQDHRHGIVHCQITRRDQLEKMGQLKLHIYAQTVFLDYDSAIVEARVGKELASTSYSWKTLMELGASVSNGTDCPVEAPPPLRGIQCAVTRQSISGENPPYLPEQAFTVREALDSYTAGSAYASFEEAVKGKIQPGMLADFVVLGEDPFAVEPNTLHTVAVLETYLAGVCVYRQ